jgi:hypothetical protein
MAPDTAVAFPFHPAQIRTRATRTLHRTTVRCLRLQTLPTHNKVVFMPAQQAPSSLMVVETLRQSWSSDGGLGTPAPILATRSVQQPVA